MRIAIPNSDDSVELKEVNGVWVTDDCEPVQVAFEWQRPAPAPVAEEDFICSPELAARLIHMLRCPEDDQEQAQTVKVATLELAHMAAPVV